MSSTDTHSLTALRRGVIKGLELIDCELRSSAGWTVPMPSTPWFTCICSLGFSTWIAYINVSCLNEMKVKTCTRAIFFNPWPVTHQLSHVTPFWHTIYHSIKSYIVQWPMSQVATCDTSSVTGNHLWHGSLNNIRFYTVIYWRGYFTVDTNPTTVIFIFIMIAQIGSSIQIRSYALGQQT